MNTQVALIVAAVARHFGVGELELLARSKSKTTVFARQVAIYLTLQILNLSYPEIGRQFDRDHTTAIHACRRIGNDPTVKPHLSAVVSRLSSQEAA